MLCFDGVGVCVFVVVLFVLCVFVFVCVCLFLFVCVCYDCYSKLVCVPVFHLVFLFVIVLR